MKKACIEKGGLKAFTCTQAVMDWHLMVARESQKFCVVVPGEVTNYVVPTLIASTGLTGTSGAFPESNLHHQPPIYGLLWEHGFNPSQALPHCPCRVCVPPGKPLIYKKHPFWYMCSCPSGMTCIKEPQRRRQEAGVTDWQVWHHPAENKQPAHFCTQRKP